MRCGVKTHCVETRITLLMPAASLRPPVPRRPPCVAHLSSAGSPSRHGVADRQGEFPPNLARNLAVGFNLDNRAKEKIRPLALPGQAL